jgi:hypothetical protein
MGDLELTSTWLRPINNFTKDEFKDALSYASQVLFMMRVGEVSIAAFIKTEI